jgi:hypothetical protein
MPLTVKVYTKPEGSDEILISRKTTVLSLILDLFSVGVCLERRLLIWVNRDRFFDFFSKFRLIEHLLQGPDHLNQTLYDKMESLAGSSTFFITTMFSGIGKGNPYTQVPAAVVQKIQEELPEDGKIDEKALEKILKLIDFKEE